MNAGAATPFIEALNENWRANANELAVHLENQELEINEAHPLRHELEALSEGRSASLPYFGGQDVTWCTVASDGASLRGVITDLHAWVLPSFGTDAGGLGFVAPETARGPLAARILTISPHGYYRWRCRVADIPRVLDIFILWRGLEERRPPRTRPPRPSLYELRARFGSALLVGDREAAESAIESIDSQQLDSAVNTQFMRIRLWHHFREYDRIRDNPELPRLFAQPLPSRVREWINEAIADGAPARATPIPRQEGPEAIVVAPSIETPPATQESRVTVAPPEAVQSDSAVQTWGAWFASIARGERMAAETFLAERRETSPRDLAPGEIRVLVNALEELFLNDTLREERRDLLTSGLPEFLEEHVREPEFPRAERGDLYLALLRVWSTLFAGTSSGREHGHVLIELANAALRLNRMADDVARILEHWWKARPSRSQLAFALDAIELLEREYTNPLAPANLWLSAADVILRCPDALLPSEKTLWRNIGRRLGIDDESIAQYLPAEIGAVPTDPLIEAKLHHVAIVCMREPQAREAANEISTRTGGAQVTLVTGKSADANTDHAHTADVILFVWMATSHAVFRAFDRVDRKRISYVQGTGADSIVRSLERWIIDAP